MEQPKVPPEWFEHVATLKMRRHIETIRDIALNALMAACEHSSDEKVRQRHATYQVLGDIAKIMTLDPDKSEEDDDGPEPDRTGEE